MRHYTEKVMNMLPRFVAHYLRKGYEIEHIGMLCWCPIPPITMIPRARLRFLALEGAFTNLLFSSVHFTMDAMWHPLVPYTRDDSLWLPLNSHSPFNEGIEERVCSAERMLGKE